MLDELTDDVAAIGRIGCLSSILELCSRLTGMRYVAVARVTDARWMACAVLDRAGFGIVRGDELDLSTTICDEVRGHLSAILIENVAEDPIYRDHPTPQLFGFQSYVSAPIIRVDGRLFGTLFAIDPAPAKLANSSAPTAFGLFAQLIAMELDRA